MLATDAMGDGWALSFSLERFLVSFCIIMGVLALLRLLR